MKKITLLLVAAVLLMAASTASNAQFSAGLRIGFNASKYTGDYSSAYKFVPGLHIGPYFRVAFKEKYRVQADLLFSTKGAAYDGISPGATGTETYYNIPFYIDVPIMFNYKPIAGLYVEAGVQPSFATTTLTFSENTKSEFNSNKNAGIKTIDFAPIVGVGYEFSKVSLGLRGAFGVTNVNDVSSSPWASITALNQKNLTLMATFGFKF